MYWPGRRSRIYCGTGATLPTGAYYLDPNGAWSLNEAIKIGKYLKVRWLMQKIRVVRSKVSPGVSDGGVPSRDWPADRNQYDRHDWRQMGHTLSLQSVDIPLADRISGRCKVRYVWRKCAMNLADLGFTL